VWGTVIMTYFGAVGGLPCSFQPRRARHTLHMATTMGRKTGVLYIVRDTERPGVKGLRAGASDKNPVFPVERPRTFFSFVQEDDHLFKSSPVKSLCAVGAAHA